MTIDQRNEGVTKLSTSTNNSYGVDRFFTRLSMGKLTVTRLSTGTPNDYTNYQEVVVSSIALAVNAATFTYLSQNIEGTNMQDFLWGTPIAKTVTLSFWVKSSSAGLYGGALGNSSSNRDYPFTYPINTTTDWEYKSIVIPGDTSGTWLRTTGIGIALTFDLGSGSSFRATPGAWGSANIIGANNTNTPITVLGSSWNITGVQLEVGPQSTAFEYRPEEIEIGLCQRYYEKSLGFRYSYSGINATGFAIPFHFSTVKKSNPIMTVNGGSLVNVSAVGFESPTTRGFTFTFASSATALNAIGNSDDATWIADSDYP